MHPRCRAGEIARFGQIEKGVQERDIKRQHRALPARAGGARSSPINKPINLIAQIFCVYHRAPG
jgi:hypothetical protein